MVVPNADDRPGSGSDARCYCSGPARYPLHDADWAGCHGLDARRPDARHPDSAGDRRVRLLRMCISCYLVAGQLYLNRRAPVRSCRSRLTASCADWASWSETRSSGSCDVEVSEPSAPRSPSGASLVLFAVFVVAFPRELGKAKPNSHAARSGAYLWPGRRWRQGSRRPVAGVTPRRVKGGDRRNREIRALFSRQDVRRCRAPASTRQAGRRELSLSSVSHD